MFETLGDRSRREMVVDVFVEAADQVGQVVTYDELAEVLGLEGGDTEDNRKLVQSVVNTAKKNIQKKIDRSVRVVSNQGYEILPASESIELARHHRKKGGRQQNKEIAALEHLRTDELTPAEKTIAEATLNVSRQLRTLTKRIERKEAENRARFEEHEERLDKLEEQLVTDEQIEDQ